MNLDCWLQLTPVVPPAGAETTKGRTPISSLCCAQLGPVGWAPDIRGSPLSFLPRPASRVCAWYPFLIRVFLNCSLYGPSPKTILLWKILTRAKAYYNIVHKPLQHSKVAICMKGLWISTAEKCFLHEHGSVSLVYCFLLLRQDQHIALVK